MRRILALPALALTAACGTASPAVSPSPSPLPFTVHGTLSLNEGGSQNGEDGEPCVMLSGGYDDIREGAQVVVSDEAGATIALGRLGSGVFRRRDDGSKGCDFPFAVEQVPPGHGFYGVEVSHRGRLQYTAEQARRPLELELGD